MVLPRTSPSDHIAVAVGISEFEKHAAGMPDDAMALFLIFAGLGFLYPALTALRLGRHWHGGVFTIMAMLCVAYQYMVMNFKVADIQPLLILAQHGWSYFCLLQTLFMVLGPEDPSMQWIDYQGAVKKSGESLCPAPPFHVVVLSRVMPIGAIGFFLCFHSPHEEDFHWQMSVLITALCLFVCSVFWMHPDRCSSMPKVLLRIRFWQRLWYRCAVPGLLASFFWALTESIDSRAMTGYWYLFSSFFAEYIYRTVHDVRGNSHPVSLMLGLDPWLLEDGIMAPSRQNPIVVHFLLGCVVMFGLPTLIFSLASDWWAVGIWRWPLISRATYQRPGGYFVALGALPTLTAEAFAFWLISSTIDRTQSNTKEVALSKSVGCTIGYMSVASGLLALAMPDSAFPTLHTLAITAFCCLMVVATMLTTLSSKPSWLPSMVCRYILTIAILISVLGYLALLVLAQNSNPNGYRIPQRLFASSEYTTMLFMMLWPLTWGSEVQGRWQRGHKAWRSFVYSQML